MEAGRGQKGSQKGGGEAKEVGGDERDGEIGGWRTGVERPVEPEVRGERGGGNGGRKGERKWRAKEGGNGG